MKIKSYVALTLAGCTAIALGLGEIPILAEDIGATEKNVSMNPNNAVQHMVNVKIICEKGDVNCSSDEESILKIAGENLVGIQTNNFVLSKEGEDKNKIINSSISNILGGVKNEIEGGEASTILGGESNINKGKYSTILGGNNNKIGETSQSNYSTIVGGTSNTVNGSNSVVVGGSNNKVNGDNSAVLGTGSEVNGDNSVALGKNSKNNANNSFLWTDGSHSNDPLETDNVFAVYGKHGMVVNADKAHPLAQLTIGGPLVIHKSTDGADVACNDQNSGVVKVVDGEVISGTSETYKCFCSCDGRGYWHSLYGQGRCEGMCNGSNEHPAGCGNSTCTKKKNANNKWIYSGSCNEYSKPIRGAGAYVVDKYGKLHWTCQTDAGKMASCEASQKCQEL